MCDHNNKLGTILLSVTLGAVIGVTAVVFSRRELREELKNKALDKKDDLNKSFTKIDKVLQKKMKKLHKSYSENIDKAQKSYSDFENYTRERLIKELKKAQEKLEK